LLYVSRYFSLFKEEIEEEKCVSLFFTSADLWIKGLAEDRTRNLELAAATFKTPGGGDAFFSFFKKEFQPSLLTQEVQKRRGRQIL